MTGAFLHLTWREPLWLGLALVPWLGWVLGALARRSRRRDYADRQLLPWAAAASSARFAPTRLWRQASLALAWLLFALAMAGPRVPEKTYDQSSGSGPQLMVVLDLSRAMTARDVAPSRLELAKLELQDLIARSQDIRIGLVVYAGTPHLMVPPTKDKSVLLLDLGLLRYGLLPTAGSNLKDAIEFAAGQFLSDKTTRSLLLVTNGGLTSKGSTAVTQLDETAVHLRHQGVFIDALGVGTRQGAPLQTRNGGWLHYEGKAVVTRLHEKRLRELAALGHGLYATASETNWATESQEFGRRLLESQTGVDKVQGLVAWHELYGWFLVPGILFLLLAYFEPRRASQTSLLFPWLFLGVLSATLLPPTAHASPQSLRRQAYQAYVNRAYLVAKRDYARIAGYAGRMGQGSSAYRLGEYRQAARLFTQAILDADSDTQRAHALFDLADCRYRQENFNAAATLYRQTLLYSPHDHDARTNLALAIAAQKQSETKKAGKARPGRGPRIGGAPEGTIILHGASLAGPARPKPRRPARLPATLPSSGKGKTNQGFDFSASSTGTKAGSSSVAQNYALTTPERIELEAESLKVDQSLLWQRIFARQAGFPAPPKTPREIKGVLPW